MSQQAADDLVAEGNELFRAERYAESANRFERATQIFPPHALAWKGLGHSLLCMGRAHEAARAFDQAIGLKPDSATALWGGAVAHAEIGNKVMAKNYLMRALALQPSWSEMALSIPQLAHHLQTSARAAEALKGAFGTFSTRTFRHAADATRSLEIARVVDKPRIGHVTYATIGLSNREWPDAERPRVELVLASLRDEEACPQILANLAFHLADTGFFPEPGVMVRDVVGALGVADLSTRLPHVYITVPRAWTLRLPIDDLPPPITLAQVIPVSEAEYALWRGDPIGFAASFFERGIDAADLRRAG
ncbi:MAG TPA: suppressor of fused domain protein [Kofleriaceae bacterium]|nr:suppressor of fused domain protein [Kofleriaceae bacterium]